MSSGSYASNQSDGNFRKWLVPMLLLSLALHFCLLIAFQLKKLHAFAPVQTERLIPRAFNLKRAEIDPRALQTTEVPKTDNLPAKPIPDVTKLPSSSPKKAFETALAEIRAAPAAVADLDKPLLNEKPKLDPSTINPAIQQMEERSSRALEREMENLRKELTAQKPVSANQPALLAEGLTDASPDLVDSPSNLASKLKGTNAGPDVGTPGFSNLDDLLSQTGPLTSGTAPILMPTDLLFEYDSFDLREGAVSSMANLGKLIQKHPAATFIIEGYTDSFGSADYNRQLSLNRAESVKAWLMQNMGIDPAHVQTRGFGSSKLLVPASKSVAEQQLNRRVEIVIRTK